MKISIKKISSCILALFMAIGLTTICAFADSLPDGVEWSGSSDAITYSDSTITISGDGTLTISEDVTASIVVSSGTVTIDVADGVTLTNATPNSNKNHTVMIAQGATVTLKGGTYKNTANDSSNTSSAVVYNEGTCIIESGTYTNSSSANKAYYTIVNANYGTMTINGGTFSGDASVSGSSLIRNVGVYDANSDGTYDSTECTATLTINDGTFGDSTNNKIAIKNDLCGTLIINGGTFYGYDQSVQNWSTATINGGTFNSMVCTWSANYTMDYSSTTDIYDGTFNDDVRAYSNYKTTSDDVCSTVTIYGGTFNDIVVAVDYQIQHSSDITSFEKAVTKNDEEASVIIYHGDFTSSDYTTGAYASYFSAYQTSLDEDHTIFTTVDVDGTAVVHNLVYVEAVDATCTEDGNIAYYYCDVDGCENPYFEYIESEEAYEQLSASAVVVSATGHTYSFTSESWSDDYTSLTVTWTCVEGDDVYTVTTTDITLEEDEEGTIWYTAVVEGPYEVSYTFTASVEGTSSDTTDSVDTGDASHVYAWLTMMLAAGFVLIGKGVYTIKRNR